MSPKVNTFDDDLKQYQVKSDDIDEEKGSNNSHRSFERFKPTANIKDMVSDKLRRRKEQLQNKSIERSYERYGYSKPSEDTSSNFVPYPNINPIQNKTSYQKDFNPLLTTSEEANYGANT